MVVYGAGEICVSDDLYHYCFCYLREPNTFPSKTTLNELAKCVVGSIVGCD